MCLTSFFNVSIAIEDDYLGPKLEGDKVTLDFMKQLMECYKNQGKLHRKYAYKVGILNLAVCGA
jgi:PPP5 TPR repeat region